MKVGSLCAGIGGLDLALHGVYSKSTVAWQADLVGEKVRRRHWRRARQMVGDLWQMPLDSFSRVDAVIMGFPCQDLSCSGSRRGLAGARSGLFYRCAEIIRYLRPELVIIENVPALVSKYRDAVEAELDDYGFTWAHVAAAQAGAPDVRWRVFTIARRGAKSTRRILRGPKVPRNGEPGVWPIPVRGRRLLGAWEPTADPSCSRGSRVKTHGYRHPRVTGGRVYWWPTPTKGDRKASGSRSLTGSKAHSGTSLTDAVRADRTKAGRQFGLTDKTAGGLLSPAWVECLQGFPVCWTESSGRSQYAQALRLVKNPQWPAPRVIGLDGLSPQYAYEPPRLLPKGSRNPGRPARLEYLGNAVVPQQGYLGLQMIADSIVI